MGLFRHKKTPPTFAPLVTDMHCHLLPQVDDGSKSLEESLDVMQVMKEVGFDEIRLTPHYCYPRFPNQEKDIQERYRKFQEEVDSYRGSMNLPMIKNISGEYRIDDGFQNYIEKGDMLVTRFADEKRESNKGLLLVELPLHMASKGFDKVIYSLLLDDYDIILAHPERYPYFNVHSKEMEQLKEQGVYFQINILSLDGFYGEDSCKKAFDYIEAGWTEFLGTDMHNVMYAQALRHAAGNRKIQHLLEREEFENKKLVDKNFNYQQYKTL